MRSTVSCNNGLLFEVARIGVSWKEETEPQSWVCPGVAWALLGDNMAIAIRRETDCADLRKVAYNTDLTHGYTDLESHSRSISQDHHPTPRDTHIHQHPPG
jgi:hypothetical protein